MKLVTLFVLSSFAWSAFAAERRELYSAHDTVADSCGVIAPWHAGQNGPLDERLRIAVDVMKRYPWVDTRKAVMAAPDFVYNSHWSIKDDGTILIPPTNDWMCGDLSQRAWSTIKGFTDYYAYSGDPVAFTYIRLTADYILDYAQTPEDHPWPRFPIATPTRGKAYGKCDPDARIQLDLCAIVGREMLRAHRLTGEPRYLDAARRWADVFADHADFHPLPGVGPWNRYVDPAVVGWSDVLTGTTLIIVEFLDDVIATGYTGGGKLVHARDAGKEFVNDILLPRWLENDTWGRTYWDWDNPTMCGMVSMCADAMLARREDYPRWRTDIRNMLPLVFNRNGADPNSHGDVYSGAWAFPESSTCCGTSLSYNQYTAGPTWLRYGQAADDDWAREIGRRMMIMATYDSAENGVVKDGLFGQAVATGEWSNLAHPWPMCQVMAAIFAWPEMFAPVRENHLVGTSSVVMHIEYGDGRIAYTTFDENATDTLRLSYRPTSIAAGDERLPLRATLNGDGYTLQPMPCGDWMVRIRRSAKNVVILGDDPAYTLAGDELQRERNAVLCTFVGNQLVVRGDTGPDGGLADVLLDGERQLTQIDSWSATPRAGQTLYRKSGLSNGPHELSIAFRGKGNPLSNGKVVHVAEVIASDATGEWNWGAGGGPAGPQRMIFGYPWREDYTDTHGNAWKPATEFVIRSGYGRDTVADAWWTERRSMYIGGAEDEELYRYGVHGRELWVNLTAAPGTYTVRLHFAETPLHTFLERDKDGGRITHTARVLINGAEVERVNVSEAAGGLFRALVRTYENVVPRHGAIEVRLIGEDGSEAILQALELVKE